MGKARDDMRFSHCVSSHWMYMLQVCIDLIVRQLGSVMVIGAEDSFVL